MSDMNLSPEELQEALAAIAGQMPPDANLAFENLKLVLHDAASIDGVPNVIKVGNNEIRGIVLNKGIIKDVKESEDSDTTTQEYVSGEDVIIWMALFDNQRFLVIQDNNDISELPFDRLTEEFSVKSGYALSFLSSFSSDRNRLLDKDELAAFDEVDQYVSQVFGGDGHIKSYMASMCLKTPNWQERCDTWETAEVFEFKDDLHPIQWGVSVETEDNYVKFDNTYVILWVKPTLLNDGGEEVPDSLTQMITRQINLDVVPKLGKDSKANFVIDETINNQFVAYAVVVDDSLTSTIKSVKLYKTADFDITKTSF